MMTNAERQRRFRERRKRMITGERNGVTEVTAKEAEDKGQGAQGVTEETIREAGVPGGGDGKATESSSRGDPDGKRPDTHTLEQMDAPEGTPEGVTVMPPKGVPTLRNGSAGGEVGGRIDGMGHEDVTNRMDAAPKGMVSLRNNAAGGGLPASPRSPIRGRFPARVPLAVPCSMENYRKALQMMDKGDTWRHISKTLNITWPALNERGIITDWTAWKERQDSWREQRAQRIADRAQDVIEHTTPAICIHKDTPKGEVDEVQHRTDAGMVAAGLAAVMPSVHGKAAGRGNDGEGVTIALQVIVSTPVISPGGS